MYSMLSLGLVLGSLLSYGLAVFMALVDSSLFIEWELFSFNSGSVVMSLIFDWMSLVFLGSVCLISGSILKYSIYYMSSEKNYLRFVIILMLFVMSMWFLIISPNMVSLLLGWDGLGLSSYALVIFYQSESSCNAGMLTVLSNRIGDVAILMSIGLMSFKGGWSYVFMEEASVSVVVLVCLASMTKSAQVPFSAWLPAAMAAPTPVSALVHSSTLVTAGVYLLIRFNSILMQSGVSVWLLGVGVLTMLMAGLNANLETDLKKVVALSTLSQLGLMVMTLSLGLPELAFFHLITHAMFKSTLFMCVGFMIHSMGGYQDSRMMSGLVMSSPFLGCVFSLTNMALAGFPFLAGFYSKDVILEVTYNMEHNFLLLVGVVLATGLTMAYSMRVLYLSSGSQVMLGSCSSVEDADSTVMSSVAGLFLGSVASGYLVSWVFMPLGSSVVLGSSEKGYTLGVSFIGGLVMFFMLSVFTRDYKKGYSGGAEMSVSQMLFMPFLSKGPISEGSLEFGAESFKVNDSGWMEFYGGQGARKVILLVSVSLQAAQRSVMVSFYLVSVLLVSLVCLSLL
uniref:NADH-ubiquinone oxidoreductase chain 5 n=1 Tax=Eurythenes maldoror TaxID=1836943 RepID=A0A343RBC6_9CRUS|nr:NADH dehydrogenase subunit 5 [Eurythenes maldoror]ATX68769.1 NADH dehydrogenase subunit 5 [Eurythenes maldoror]